MHKTDAFVILATKGVLTRPWCIMEMWEAARHQIPVRHHSDYLPLPTYHSPPTSNLMHTKALLANAYSLPTTHYPLLA